jgi:DNA replication protein DnaC
VFGEYFMKLAEQSHEVIKAEDGDFIKDGLLHCGKCQTAKQTNIEFMGQIVKPMCLCKCEIERKEKEAEEERQRQRAERIAKNRTNCFPERQMEDWTFENDDGANEKLTNMAKRYVAHFDSFVKDGKGLLLYGGVGTGKTYLACMIANALLDKGYPVLVTNFSRILNTLQGNFEHRQDYLDGFNRFSLLVIDDLGVERGTEFAKEQVYNVIDSRCLSGLPMIITTNLSVKKLANEIEIGYKRIYDRIIEKCYPVEVAGESRRIKKLIEGKDDMKNILGI